MLRNCRLLIFALLVLFISSANSALEQYDNEKPRPVGLVLPPELVAGDLWTVEGEAVPFEGLFQFQLSSPWGSFPVYGEAMLRMRVREFQAIEHLSEISSTEAAVKGAGTAVKKSFVRLGHAVVHPKRTAEALPQGTRRLFAKLNRYAKKIFGAVFDQDGAKAKGEGDEADQSAAAGAAVWLARKYGGVGSKLRRRARDVGVDPYTSNEVLAEELERVSRAEAAGSVSSKLLLPVVAGGVGLIADAANIAYVTEWREVFTYNAGLMRDMDVSDELLTEFQLNPFFTPMTQTLIVAMLAAIDTAENRAAVIEQATFLQNEAEALFFLESVMLAEWYHRERSKLKAFHLDTLIPVATDSAGDLVAFTAADFMYWTPETEQVSQDFTATYAGYAGGRKLILADYISSRAQQGVELLGWSVESGLRQSYDVEVPWGRQDHR